MFNITSNMVSKMAQPTTDIRVALDWTPNTLHAGLYLAFASKLYSSANLNVSFIVPDAAYSTTPAKLVATGQADLAICPSESCIAYAESDKDIRLQAIYAICQKDASAIVTASNRFAKLKDLEGATYGSYNARYEDDTVRAMISNAGGDGSKMKIKQDAGKLGLFEAVRKGEGVDATWVFMPWEGLMAEMEEASPKLNVFKLEEYGIPYSYSPVIARNAAGTLNDEAIRKFVKATQEGYRMATQQGHVDAAVEALKPHCDPSQSEAFLKKSLQYLMPYYGSDTTKLGHMEIDKWEKWVSWLKNHDLIKDKKLEVGPLFTNEFL
jgi:ABC-type nitrate/sulfonate/bicarbonate transport system substrate-binding protein